MTALPPGSINHQEVGRRLREARARGGLSQRELATRVGLSPSAVSQIETGASQPSVRTLWALAAELSLSLDELLDHRPAASHESRDRRLLHRTDRAALELNTGVRLERLTPEPDSLLDFLHLTYPPGSHLNAYGRLMRSGGIEMGVVLSGELDVTTGSKRFRLGPGDSIALPWDEPHRFVNNGSEPVSCVWAILPDRLDRKSAGQPGATPAATLQD